MARKSRKHQAVQQEMELVKYKVGIYARISYAENDNSVQMQIDSLKGFIFKNKDMQLVEIYSDVNISSFDSDRPSFKKMLEDVKNRKINCIIVRDFSRFGRDYIETGNYIEKIFPFLNVRFISISDGYDSNNLEDIDYFANSLKQLINYYYSADLSQKVKKSIRIKMSSGKYIAPKIPYGYEKTKNLGETIYTPVQSQADNIKEIFRLALLEHSVYSITKILNQQNADNRVWTQGFVKRILCNKFYTGTYETGKIQSDFRRKTVTKISPEKWYITENHHEAIVDDSTFYTVEKILSKQQVEREPSDKTQDLYKAILYCGDCKKKLKRVRRKKGNGYTVSYICPTYASTSYILCSSKHITEKKLKLEIENQLNIKIDKAIEHQEKQIAYENSLKYKLWYDYRMKKLAELKSEIEKLPDRLYIKGILEEYLDETEETGNELKYILGYFRTQREKIQEQVDMIEAELLQHRDNQSSQVARTKAFLAFQVLEFDIEKVLKMLVNKIEVYDCEIIVGFNNLY